jgi:hypothetical protein
MKLIIFLVVLIIIPQWCFADETSVKNKNDTATVQPLTGMNTVQPEMSIIDQNKEEAERFWSNFGVGLLLNFDLGHRKPIKSASIINNKVVVEEEDDTKYGLGLEVHKFMFGSTVGGDKNRHWTGSWAVGPYVSVLPGTNEVIDALGAGIIVGFFGRPDKINDNTTNKAGFSMNLLIGGYIDPQTQVLADGFIDGAAPPAGETSVRYKNVTQYGIQGGLSFNYGF